MIAGLVGGLIISLVSQGLRGLYFYHFNYEERIIECLLVSTRFYTLSVLSYFLYGEFNSNLFLLIYPCKRKVYMQKQLYSLMLQGNINTYFFNFTQYFMQLRLYQLQ